MNLITLFSRSDLLSVTGGFIVRARVSLVFDTGECVGSLKNKDNIK
jgi:hypothetical protein